MERSLASFDKDLRELKAITELSMEIRASQSLSENIKLQDEFICLRDKVIDQSYLISELQAKLENVVNERNSLLTTLHIIQRKNNCTELQKSIVHNEPLFPPEPSDNNSPSFTSSISILVGDKSLANKTLDDNEIQDVINVGEKHISKAVQV